MAKFNVLVEWDRKSRAWVTYVPSLDWLSTFGATREEAILNTKEAAAGYLEAAAKEGIELHLDDGEAELTAVEVPVP